jgi:hydroxyethylthiazole kinase-like uncharacterized protein yjeF
MSKETGHIKWSARKTKKYIYIPNAFDSKYSRGVLGLVTGSTTYPGAAVLTASAAMTTGVGMVRFQPVRSPFNPSKRNLVETLVIGSSPEVVVKKGPVTAWLLGSGVANSGGVNTWLRQRDFTRALHNHVPLVLDAGALHLAGKSKSPTLITPHAGELAALMSARGEKVSSAKIAAQPDEWVKRASEKLGVSVLLKGSVTYLSDGDEIIELPKATPWLATAGTGDVLAGIIGAIVASNSQSIMDGTMSINEAGASGAFIHARAAEKASNGGPVSAVKINEKIAQVISSIIT